ncbi:flagellar export chaperone FliS [Nitriliruptoraceae bacterium ZYF776]|nr:flagellar export chaperone FliS [Profundirhabdus halotolerans]
MDPRAQYRAQAASTASPAQLVLMLFDGVLGELDRAEAAIAEPLDHAAAHDALVRAQRIVQELDVTLDHDQGGAIAGNLASLYAFVSEQLLEANLVKSAAPLAGVRDVVRPLRDAWAEACVGVGAPVAVAG